jgi:NTP pyrophosphatase (non-canonical NTP hydrolase)
MNYQEKAYRTAQTDLERCQRRLDKSDFTQEVIADALMNALRAGHAADNAKRFIFYGKGFEVERIETQSDAKMVAAAAMDRHTLKAGRTEKMELLHALLGIMSETAELIEVLVPSFYGDEPIDYTNVREEFGDENWYLALGCSAIKTTLEMVQQLNIQKLEARYGPVFTEEAAINRDTDAERAILENEREET